MSFQAVTIKRFIGMDKTRDELNLQPGQLIYNQNFRYESGGGLRERGGGAKLSDAPASAAVYGAFNYKNSSASEFLLTAQGTDLYYYSSGWNAFSLTLTANQITRFEEAGFDTDRAVYAVNGSQNVVKIYTSGTPTAELVTAANGYLHDSPTDGKYIKQHKNRLWIASDDAIYYSDVLDFDHLDPADSIKIVPGVDGFIKGLAVWGDALFIFKEFGIYIIPNADDATPSNWLVLRANALTGTQSPDSIVQTKIGVIYFASDDTVRFIAPNISFSSGEYTLGGSGTPIMSHDIETDINELLDRTQKDNIVAVEKEDEYIFGFKSVNNASNYPDLFYFADVSKFHQIPDIPQPQPYWGQYTNFDYSHFAKQTVSGRVKLYGFKGDDGECHETLNDSINNDNSTAIDSYAVMSWLPIAGEEVQGILERIIFVGETEDWEIDIKVDGYQLGNTIPEIGSGITKTFTVNVGANVGVVGSAVVGTATVGVKQGASQRYRIRLKGNYFKCEFRNANADEFIRIQKVIFYYNNIRSK